MLVVALLAVAGLIGYALYYFFTKTGQIGEPTIPPSTSTLPGGQLPTSGTKPPSATGTTQGPGGELLPVSGIIQPSSPSYYKPAATTQIISETANHASLSVGGDFRYYNANDGKFYRVTPSGEIKPLSDQLFYSAEKVTWAKGKNQAVIEYPDNSKIVYNFDTNKQVTLPKHWEDFSFSSDGNQIAAKSLGLDPSNRWLVTINSDGTGTKLIEPMGDNSDKVIVNWSPNQQVAAFSQTGAPQGGERREVLFVGLNGENFKSAIVDGSGFMPQWSTTGKKLLYSVYSSRSDFKPELWIVDSQGDSIGNNRKLLQLNTWADKCTFGNDDTAYCAVPKNLPTGAGMSRSIAQYNYDDLYKIDLKTGLKTPISLDSDYNIKSISYDANHNKVIFTDLNKTGVFESQL
ncbi:MAG: hypothetical protein A2534_02440 [Candidatus Magasanikbacteria bacterium RIFOXYD2_FULL_39_9]|uniref:Dipeptidylpeptidase IV N-terminal domain-containing protein n=1 Tax=Candidatus Magasanikbacteria bacterium RIFOXYD1_FULL_40_23 TaxID=1798705 RepID=A0A1F6P9M4_9BACT|nr:MAG: hypothetical protein A2563_03665 [Candidatus Magasanikbacteria bacterium RIFOXYD1_FULL_40_23]OGH93483.1 MAG: hypothetical protein A2534_02440 [Candidatus Magasanikbacteria bacterium RIFOXYD2_FULL_39_9]